MRCASHIFVCTCQGVVKHELCMLTWLNPAAGDAFCRSERASG